MGWVENWERGDLRAVGGMGTSNVELRTSNFEWEEPKLIASRKARCARDLDCGWANHLLGCVTRLSSPKSETPPSTPSASSGPARRRAWWPVVTGYARSGAGWFLYFTAVFGWFGVVDATCGVWKIGCHRLRRLKLPGTRRFCG